EADPRSRRHGSRHGEGEATVVGAAEDVDESRRESRTSGVAGEETRAGRPTASRRGVRFVAGGVREGALLRRGELGGPCSHACRPSLTIRPWNSESSTCGDRKSVV